MTQGPAPAGLAAGLAEILGYSFGDESLLVQALTHASAVPGGERLTYQRLEFLGDSVLGLVVAGIVYEAFPQADEGELSRRLAALVRMETCADVAREIGLGDHLILGVGEAQTGGRRKDAILGDVCEAIIGAIYLDGGLDPARGFIVRHWADRVDETSPRLKDAKTTLQEWAHEKGGGQPVYRQLDRSGPDHEPVFTISVTVGDLEPATATGSSKRTTEQAAAEALLIREGVWEARSHG
ncbi:ribonuclease III [Microbaculum marinum]|uniref:Ribonuclease 3 n=1 Tax=Microbaculum marinum TaxID=1764581 RepID=A0AAW9RXM4_9HYPH